MTTTMKVFLVFDNLCYEGAILHGIYFTRVGAEKGIRDFLEGKTDKDVPDILKCNHNAYAFEDFYIEEWDVI